MSLRKLKEKFSSKGHIQGGDSAQTVAWNTLQTVLTIAKEAIDDVPAPGVKAALGALLAVIDTIQVCCLYATGCLMLTLFVTDHPRES